MPAIATSECPSPGETETRAQFGAEPTAYRWVFYREGDAEIWSAQLPIDALARAVIRCFDEVARSYG